MNKITPITGTTKLNQSEGVPLGLFFTISRILGNKITINITSAKAEKICIQSILPSLKNKNPGHAGVYNQFVIQLIIITHDAQNLQQAYENIENCHVQTNGCQYIISFAAMNDTACII